VAGSADGTPGTFNAPFGVAIDSAKNLYVTDTTNNTIRKITSAKVVSTLAGSAGLSGNTDGTGSAARFNFPVGIAVDGSGNVYVGDSKNFTIRKVTADGVVTTFAGAAFQFGSTDGTGSAARFFLPYGVAVDSAGNVYVADGGNQLIRKITPAGVVTTIAGSALQSGTADGTGSAARFNTPWGIAVDSSGNIYVSDSASNTIRKITSAGAVTTIAGTAGATGSADGTGAAARFNQPRGLSVGASGNIYVADYGNSVLRQITPAGVVTTIAGSAGVVGAIDSVGSSARFYDTTDVVADGSTVYVVDSSNNLVRRGVPASQASLPNIVIQPIDQEVSVGQAVSFNVVANGNGLSYQWLKNQSPITGATSASYAIASAQAIDSAAYIVRVSGAGGSIDSTQGNLTVTPVGTGPIQITARPLSQSVAVGANVTFSVTASGSGLTYQWLKNSATITGATTPSFNISSAQTGDAGTYTVRITSGSTTELATAKLVVGGTIDGGNTAPKITAQPQGKAIDLGQSVTFSVTASGSNLQYQWFKDGVAISGATSSSYTINNAQTSHAGSYVVRVSSGILSVDSNAAALTVITDNVPPPSGPTAWLSNLAVRTALASGQNLIVGFYVDGGSRDILVRAAGPALTTLGLGGAMTDPRLELYNGSTLVFSNDDWPASLGPVFDSVGAFQFPANSKDAAFRQSISGGATVQARGTSAGIVLVEAYDAGSGSSPRMTNLSARNRVGTGDEILIAGFAISGTGQKRLLLRASGPALAALGVSGTLNDPKLELYSGSTKVNENDNWSQDLAAMFKSVGAFDFPPNSKDSAMIVTLNAGGSYTVQVRGSDGGTGEALVEIYEVP
jgi:sugar lactone lactonase YvrE